MKRWWNQAIVTWHRWPRVSGLKSFFSEPRWPRQAIQLGSRMIAVASAARKQAGPVLRRAALEAVPPGLIEPRFAEINIKDRDHITRCVQRALEKAGCAAQRDWSLALPRQTTGTFVIELEEVPATRRELIEMLQWKVETLLGVSPSELTAAFEALPPLGRRQAYLVVVALNDILASYEAVLAPLGLRVPLVMPAHLAEAAWLRMVTGGSGVTSRGAGYQSRVTGHGSQATDSLLLSAEADQLSIVFLRDGHVLSVRSVSSQPEAMADEVHRTLCYYLDRLAAAGPSDLGSEREDGSKPSLETVLLIGKALSVSDVQASCRTLFPASAQPTVWTLKDVAERFGMGSGWEPEVDLDAIAAAAGLAIREA